jgi:hypothetical protein
MGTEGRSNRERVLRLDPKSVIAGAALLVLIKYLVIGLDAWNACCCSGRKEPESLVAFSKPLLSGAGDCKRCRAFWGNLGKGKGGQ